MLEPSLVFMHVRTYVRTYVHYADMHTLGIYYTQS